MDNRDFLGSGWKFPLQIDPRTGKFAMSSREENIRESIEIILKTSLGERVMRPDFGTDAIDYVFAVREDSPAQTLAFELERDLVLQEPRIVDVKVNCTNPQVTDGSMVINIDYTVRSTNNRYNVVYPFFMENTDREA